jgi:hypothetical protein
MGNLVSNALGKMDELRIRSRFALKKNGTALEGSLIAQKGKGS